MGRRLCLTTIIAVAGYYAVFGGEYTLLDLRRIHAETVEAGEELDRLRATADSLRLRADSLEHDPRTLEELARERFGMIREGEVLYRFAEGEDPSGQP